MASSAPNWDALLVAQKATEFTEEWVRHRFRHLAQEMVGLRDPSSDWMSRRVTGSLTPRTLEYAKKMIPVTDANAARLIDAALGGKLTYVSGTWHFYDGICHRPLVGVPVGFWVVMAFSEEYSSAMDWVEPEIEAEARRMVTPNSPYATNLNRLRKEWLAYKQFDISLRQNNGINALKSVLQQVCTKEDGYFDRDHKWLVCQNGVLDLEAFRKDPAHPLKAFGDHDPSLPVARAVSCSFIPGKTSDVWENFLETSLPDEEARAFLQRLAGAALLGESKVKAIPNLKGDPDSGKSVFVDTLAAVFDGYASTPSGSAIQEARGDTNFEQDELRGKRFVCITEPSAEKRVDDGFVKKFTGGDMVKSRTLHQRGGSWRPQGIIFVASNHVLKLNTRDQAILDRLCLVEFPHRFWFKYELEEMGVPEGDWHIKDSDLETKLDDEDEHDGILMWAIRGAYMYLMEGIRKPVSVKLSGEQYATDSSRALTWVQEKIEEELLYETGTVADQPLRSYALVGKLYQAYVQDVVADNEKPLGKHAFSADLKQRYGEHARAAGTRVARLVGRGNLSWVDGNVGTEI